MIPISPPPQAIIAHIPKYFHQISFKGDTKLFESHKIWSNFSEISSIYRESGHNQEISEYLKNRLQKAGFEIEQKPDGTICASRGVNAEHTNAIILQAHMDMVAISADSNPQKPIKMNIKDGWLYANDRTLGADNGLGIAAILAVADDSRFKNYPLEMIITTDEETGMDGARKLEAKDFYGKYLINLDSESYGDIIKGCAGIAKFTVNEKIKTQILSENDFAKISINLSGARGGHSAEITPDYLNPIKVLLSELKNIKDLKLISFSGGERYNAIPRDASAEFLIPKSEVQSIENILTKNLEQVKQEKSEKNPNFVYSISTEDAKIGTSYIDSKFQAKMFDSIEEIPTGLLNIFEENGCSKTSQNLGVLKISNGEFQIIVMGRSADKKEGQEVQEKTSAALSKLFDKTISVHDATPIWQPQENSKLQNIAAEAYSANSSGEKPTIKVEHGGLESAIFTAKVPDLEQISIGPTIEEPHSIQERVKVDTVLPFYDWLSKILELLK